MAMGFFPSSSLLAGRNTDLSSASVAMPKCGACGLYKLCNHKMIPVYGKGNSKILIVGSYPSQSDDQAGRALSGKRGAFLKEVVHDLGYDLYEDCWFTYSVICQPGNEKVTGKEIEFCRPNILKFLNEKRPNVIILLGSKAIQSVIGWAWKDNVYYDSSTDHWVGYKIPDRSVNAWICPTYDIQDIIREDDKMLESVFTSHISEAFDKAQSKPWKEVVNLQDQVEVIKDTRKAAKEIIGIAEQEEVTAVDYEANALKPEYSGFKVLSCSLSVLGSNRAISFPWDSHTQEAMAKFWFGKSGKVMSNAKYEDRLTRFLYKRPIRNVYWDTMLASHVIDCRGGITSIKFQVYIWIGVGAYNDHIEPFLREARGTHINLADTEIDLDQLLTYGGEDSLYEGMVAQKQIGVKL